MPVILVLNMMDEAEHQNLHLDVERLQTRLGIPIIPAAAAKGRGLREIRIALSSRIPKPPRWDDVCKFSLPHGEPEDPRHCETDRCLPPLLSPRLLLWHHLAESERSLLPAHSKNLTLVPPSKEAQQLPISAESLALTRFRWVQALIQESIKRKGPLSLTTEKMDHWVTHPVWGWVIFIGLMMSMFYALFSLASIPMDWIKAGFEALGKGVESVVPPGNVQNLLTHGVIDGVGGILVFLPQILILFFFICLLEDTGYLARAAMLMDRILHRFGLPGKAFIPLLSSYACAIPGIMATRTIEDPKDRLNTILIAPWMSCSARLPVYTLLVALLIPEGPWSSLKRAGVMIFLYALGTGMAILFAALFRKTILPGKSGSFIMELPPYRMPAWRGVFQEILHRAKLFITNAGTVILALSIVIWFLTSYPQNNPDATPTEQLQESYAGQLGSWIEPAIKPLGYDWKIGVSLLSSFAAREVFVSTMAIIYGVEGDAEHTDGIRTAILNEKWSDGSLIFTPLVCLSLMIFYVFALQCMSTIAVVKRETNGWRWPLFQLFYMTTFAYVLCWAIYRIWGP
jgi:ferrous iron transport protein B